MSFLSRSFACALLATVVCAASAHAQSVAAGATHVVLLTSTGEVWAWGTNAYGQLGDRTTVSRMTATSIPVSGVTAIAAASYTTIALLNDSTVIAWGYNADGELGNGTLTGTCQIHSNPCDLPVTVSGLSGVVAIAAGGSHVLALKGDGTLWAWGDNSYGQLGDTTTTRRTSPVQVTSLGASVVAIGAHNNTRTRSSPTARSG